MWTRLLTCFLLVGVLTSAERWEIARFESTSYAVFCSLCTPLLLTWKSGVDRIRWERELFVSNFVHLHSLANLWLFWLSDGPYFYYFRHEYIVNLLWGHFHRRWQGSIETEFMKTWWKHVCWLSFGYSCYRFFRLNENRFCLNSWLVVLKPPAEVTDDEYFNWHLVR